MNVDTEFSIHPAAHLFPQMDEQDFQVLKADIAENGLHEPIITYQGQILDGRHRYRACRELGIEALPREYEGTDPQGFVFSMNFHRRHLNSSQRALIAARLSNAKRGGDRSNPHKCGLTHAQTAAQLNVGQRLVEKAAALLNAEKAGTLSSEVLKGVSQGKLPLGQAEKIAKLPSEQQLGFMVPNKTSLCKRKRNRRELWNSELEQISLEAERTAQRMQKFIQRTDGGWRRTPALWELALEICRSTAQRFEQMSDLLEQEQGRDENRSQLPGQSRQQTQSVQTIAPQPVQYSAPALEEVCLD